MASKVVSVDITYVPHHNTLTASGRSHFSRIADGLAEFIDNSIQACSSEVSPLQKIDIRFFFVGDSGYAVVSDSGKGMNLDNLKAFATYSLDQETRGFRAQGGEHTFISKFGVGAKQAGFFLGDRIRVITQAAESSTGGSSDVMELILDRAEFEARFQAGEEVFKGSIKIRNKSDVSTTPEDELAVIPLMQMLREHEAANSSFTIVVMRLHADMVARLRNKEHYKTVADELAEIYHFHLHPEHTPNEIVQLPKFKGATVTLPTPGAGKGKRVGGG
jgi:hypothetical protein